MKKYIALLLLLAMVCSMAACTKAEPDEDFGSGKDKTKPTTVETVPQTDKITLPTAEPVTFPTAYPANQTDYKHSDDYGNSVNLPSDVDVFDYTLSFAKLPKVEHQSLYLEAEILRLTNKERQKEGLKPLLWEGGAYYFASERAKEAQEKWSHTRPNGEPYYQIFAEYKVICTSGENLHTVTGVPNDKYIYTQEGMDELPERIVDDWMDSEGHRANILNEDWESMVVAVYYDAKNDQLVSVQLFFA